MANGTGYSSEELFHDPRTIQTSCSSEDENPVSSPKPPEMGVLSAKQKGLKRALKSSSGSEAEGGSGSKLLKSSTSSQC